MSKAWKTGPLLALGCLSLIWGYNWVVMKQALRFIDPFAFAGLRSMLGALAVFGLLFLTGRSKAPGSFRGVLGLGLIQTTGFVALSTSALVVGGAGKTAVIVYTMPFWLLLLAWPILGERIKGLQWCSVLPALAGLVLILQPWRFHPRLASTLLALLAALFWAISGIWVKQLRQKVQVDLLPLTAWQLLLGSIPLLLVALAAERGSIVWSPYFVGALVYNAIPATALAWLLWLYALQELPTGVAGMGTLLTPLVGVTAAWLELGEHPGATEALGMTAVLASLAVLVVDRWSVSKGLR